VLQSAEGTRELTVDEFLLGPYTTARESNELLVEVRFPESPGKCAFFELGRRHNDFAVLAIAAAGDREGDRWRNLRVVLAGAEYRATRIDLGDSPLDEIAIGAAVFKCLEAIDPPDDVRASAEYRTHLVSVHVARVLRELRG
jgi:carbon-monoxide dehydrogenase medium subunit